MPTANNGGGLARRTVQTPSGTIGFTDRGAGPAALFVHGVFLNADVGRAPSTGHRCAALHCARPALPRRAPKARRADALFAGQAQALTELLDALGIDRVDLVGNDSGGGIAQILPHAIRSASAPSRSPIATSMTAGRRRFEPTVQAVCAGAPPACSVDVQRRERRAQRLGAWFEHPSASDETCAASSLSSWNRWIGSPISRASSAPWTAGRRCGRAAAAPPRCADADRLGHGGSVLRHQVGALAARDDSRCAAHRRAAGREAVLPLRTPGALRRRAAPALACGSRRDTTRGRRRDQRNALTITRICRW